MQMGAKTISPTSQKHLEWLASESKNGITHALHTAAMNTPSHTYGLLNRFLFLMYDSQSMISSLT